MKTTKNLVAKFAAALLAGMMLFALTSCGKDKVAGNTYFDGYTEYYHFYADGTGDAYHLLVGKSKEDGGGKKYGYADKDTGKPQYSDEVPKNIHNCTYIQDKEAKTFIIVNHNEWGEYTSSWTYEDASKKLILNSENMTGQLVKIK